MGTPFVRPFEYKVAAEQTRWRNAGRVPADSLGGVEEEQSRIAVILMGLGLRIGTVRRWPATRLDRSVRMTMKRSRSSGLAWDALISRLSHSVRLQLIRHLAWSLERWHWVRILRLGVAMIHGGSWMIVLSWSECSVWSADFGVAKAILKARVEVLLRIVVELQKVVEG